MRANRPVRSAIFFRFGAGLYLALALPPIASLLETSMVGHMLVQLPLLALAGGLVAAGVALPSASGFAGFNRGGIAGLLLAVFAWSWWMVPRHLDAALFDPWMEAAKFLAVPLLVGVPLAAGWRQAGPLVRGFFWAHVISMLLALGWLYLQSPERLCVSYRIDQQALVGTVMLVAAIMLSATLIVRAFVGPVAASPQATGASGKTRDIYVRAGKAQYPANPGADGSVLLPFDPRKQRASLPETASGGLRRAAL